MVDAIAFLRCRLDAAQPEVPPLIVDRCNIAVDQVTELIKLLCQVCMIRVT